MIAFFAKYRPVPLLLALLLYCTSVGAAVDLHFCQGKLKSFSLIGKAKNCHELAEKMKNCPHHQAIMAEEKTGCSLDKKDCCENKQIYIQSDQDQVQPGSVNFTEVQLQAFLIAFAIAATEAYTPIKEKLPFFNYKPPLILRDISVLFEVFRL